MKKKKVRPRTQQDIINGLTIESDGTYWEIWDMDRMDIACHLSQIYFQRSEAERILRRLAKRINKHREPEIETIIP